MSITKFTNIKFRVWIHKHKCFYYFSFSSPNLDKNWFSGKHTIHRFSGRNDKNGIPIFEGDIIKVYTEEFWYNEKNEVTPNYTYETVVVYNDAVQMFVTKKENLLNDPLDDSTGIALYSQEKIEVIGNVFEGKFKV